MLATLLELGVVAREQVVEHVEVPPVPTARLGAWLRGAPKPEPTWQPVQRTAYVDLAGRRRRAGDLAAWESPATRAALDAALAALDGAPAAGQWPGTSVVWGRPSALPGSRPAIAPPRRPGGL